MSVALGAIAGVAGSGIGGIGDAVGRVIGDLERALARFGSSVVSAFKSVLDKIIKVASRVANIIEKYFRIAVHYVVLFLKLGYKYMYKFYTEFQQNPWRTLQFIGTIAILLNNGLFQ
jgi:deoxyxylulose-5-phosphate synthase